MKLVVVNALTLFLLLTGCEHSKNSHDVVESVPHFSPAGEQVIPYIASFQSNYIGNVQAISLPTGSSFQGFIQCSNRLEDACVILTSADRNDVTQQQHLYFYIHGRDQLMELNLAALGEIRITNPQLALQGGAFVVLLETPTGSSICLYDIDTGRITNISPGGSVQVSPNGKSAVFLRRNEEGFCSIHILRLADLQIKTIMSLWESDPGSGVSFSYRWSLDSKVLLIEGAHGSFSRNNRGSIEQSKFFYFLESDQIFDIKNL
jgi:hypothetical protein